MENGPRCRCSWEDWALGPSPGRWAARWPAAVDGLGGTPAAPPLSFTTEDRLPPDFQRTRYSGQTHMPHTNCIESEWTSYSPKISSHSDQMHYWKTETGSGAPDAKRRFPHATVRRFDGLTVRRFVQRFPVQLLAWACMQKASDRAPNWGSQSHTPALGNESALPPPRWAASVQRQPCKQTALQSFHRT